jgi:GGDEF domain-containing protein
MHQNHSQARRPGWPALLAAALLSYAIGIITTRRWYRPRLAAAHAEANHDPLTGLPNRRAAVTEVHALLASGPFVLALLDLDDFKHVNDTHGHSAGDDLLRVVAARLWVAIPARGLRRTAWR